MREGFTTFQVTKALDPKMPRERLRELIERDFIEPSFREPGPRGDKAMFTHEAVYGIQLFWRLQRAGFDRKGSSKFVKDMLARGELTTIDYIMFKRVEDQIVWRLFGSGLDFNTFGFDWETGDPAIVPMVERLYGKDSTRKDWEEITFVNLKELRKTIDDKLLKL
ncbi:MAG: hypothetical protein JSV14_03005 [Deltaproteobacteria bacterium]|nr:MAG: hypothetical protein JSV14_03005 [Deltaproteobacteria bacterium]